MKILHYFLFALAISIPTFSNASAQGANAYITVDNQTGKILDASNAKKKRQVASLTKIATAMVVLDWMELEKADNSQLATVPNEAMQVSDYNPMGLQPGDRLSLRDLLYACLLQSDNIAAYTLANYVGTPLRRLSPAKVQSLHSIGVFVAQMNALANKLGMQDTLFLNPSGADHLGKQAPYSTAEDMARLARYAMDKGGFRFYASQRERSITIYGVAGNRAYLCRNTNELLGQQGIDGVKTGRTRLAGDCLILSSVRSSEIRQEGNTTYVTPRRITVVVLGASERFSVGASLIQRGWQLYDNWAAQGRPTNAKQQL